LEIPEWMFDFGVCSAMKQDRLALREWRCLAVAGAYLVVRSRSPH
jgi:hypothetical protein